MGCLLWTRTRWPVSRVFWGLAEAFVDCRWQMNRSLLACSFRAQDSLHMGRIRASVNLSTLDMNCIASRRGRP